MFGKLLLSSHKLLFAGKEQPGLIPRASETRLFVTPCTDAQDTLKNLCDFHQTIYLNPSEAVEGWVDRSITRMNDFKPGEQSLYKKLHMN